MGGSTPLIRVLYRLKKWQYLLYKHALLHGLNASVAVDGGYYTRAPDNLPLIGPLAGAPAGFQPSSTSRRLNPTTWCAPVRAHALPSASSSSLPR